MVRERERNRMKFPKPDVVRLTGKTLEALRLACYLRDKGQCVKCGRKMLFKARFPNDPIAFDMAHKRGKRMHGDTLNNVESLCHAEHMLQHRYGKSYQKPVPSKRG